MIKLFRNFFDSSTVILIIILLILCLFLSRIDNEVSRKIKAMNNFKHEDILNENLKTE